MFLSSDQQSGMIFGMVVASAVFVGSIIFAVFFYRLCMGPFASLKNQSERGVMAKDVLNFNAVWDFLIQHRRSTKLLLQDRYRKLYQKAITLSYLVPVWFFQKIHSKRFERYLERYEKRRLQIDMRDFELIFGRVPATIVVHLSDDGLWDGIECPGWISIASEKPKRLLKFELLTPNVHKYCCGEKENFSTEQLIKVREALKCLYNTTHFYDQHDRIESVSIGNDWQAESTQNDLSQGQTSLK